MSTLCRQLKDLTTKDSIYKSCHRLESIQKYLLSDPIHKVLYGTSSYGMNILFLL